MSSFQPHGAHAPRGVASRLLGGTRDQRHARCCTRRLADARAEFTVFAAIGALGLLLTQALLWVLVEGFDAEPLVARVMTAGVVFLINFSLRKLMLFSRGGNAGGAHV